ncbi:MAG: adenylate class-3/4/guanylyl cyclase [Rhizobiaceae bacterium MnEN-MB40S]|nr:MAG: adenylate class-3/4/guanylyl cyclase [Rhizobiaceae bacterium MnEN-MB40S]
MERRLSAVFSADMVGYSRLIEADEIGTLERHKAHRAELMDPAFADHRGRVVKETGDGVIVEFSSVVEALTCALAIQRAMPERECAFDPALRIAYRIGVNLGDIVVDGNDIFGDGVNLAARLEQLSEPGGVCVSGAVYDQIEGKSGFSCKFMGDKLLKNIARPVRVYEVLVNPDRCAGRDVVTPRLAPDKPSIAVTPFVNKSDNPAREYFSDGVTEDIITELSRFSELLVIAHTSTLAYKGGAVDHRKIAIELGVSHILEGSVRTAGDRVRITAQLVEADSGHRIWAERYDRDLEDIFSVQDEIVSEITGTLFIRLRENASRHALRKRPSSLGAWDHALRALALILRFNPDDNREARREAEAAVKIDPDFAWAHAILAFTWVCEGWSHWDDDPVDALRKGHEWARKAIALNRDEFMGHAAFGLTELVLYQRHESAISALRQAVALNPNNADFHALLATALNFSGDPEEGLAAIKRALRLNPRCPDWYWQMLGRSHFMLGQYDTAITHLEALSLSAPGMVSGRAILAACLAALERYEDAQSEVRAILAVSPGYSLAHAAFAAPYRDKAALGHFLGLLRASGLPD